MLSIVDDVERHAEFGPVGVAGEDTPLLGEGDGKAADVCQRQSLGSFLSVPSVTLGGGISRFQLSEALGVPLAQINDLDAEFME